ncbi:ATP synthase F1 subunit epsilon [Clostridium sp. MCC353]|uniref:ATP synthase F1 subunit epsilon n=1 Tax=Clostridium sp. MCC353 TaxID=2592646 RepID=UPI001C030458|nr:ATP synthase F1 subunit epsilon [Clostridium sp. MCC353]MBT9777000.1 ATP synthase F1 subunit epsilon [Clostridium sp. MCC353]
MNTFYLKIIASDRVFFEGRCRMIVLPVFDGEKAVQAHHENMVIAVSVGGIRITTEDGTKVEGVVGSGFAQIINNRVTLLVDTAEKPEEIDVRRAREALERAKEQLRQKQSIQEHSHSEASLARAIARLRMKSQNI